jgi:uncharacterized membrane protein YdbT with pleckstrin-like domain
MEEQKHNDHSYSYTVRQSPFLLVMRIITAEVVIMIFHYFTRFILDQFFLFLNAKQPLLVFTTEVILIQVLNIYILLIAILSWLNKRYIFNPKEIIVKTGIVNTKSTTYEIANLQSMSISQNIIQKLFNFGSIKLFNPVLKEEIYVTDIPDPHKYGEIIQQYQPENTPLIRKPK